jgi:hypothetical protein
MWTSIDSYDFHSISSFPDPLNVKKLTKEMDHVIIII